MADPQLLIALHSPDALLETDCECAFRRKSRHGTASDAEQSVLCGPVCLGIIAKYRYYSRISAQSEWNFSAVQTAWRRKCDSNSHYHFEFRNPRRLRDLQAVLRLTRESTSSDWPPIDKKKSIFSSAPSGERHTIVWLKVVAFVPWEGTDIG
jgi:hypothetical protein